jgi:hypothetical protein
LNAQSRREALEAYEYAHKKAHTGTDTGYSVSFRPGKLPLIHAWPWDARAPVPFACEHDPGRRSRQSNMGSGGSMYGAPAVLAC